MKKPLSLSIVLLAGTCVGIGPVWSAQTRTNPTEQIQKGPIQDKDASSSGSNTSSSGSSQYGNDSPSRSTSGGMSQSSMRGHMGAQTNVRAAQEALRDKGFDPGPVDGIMGPKTQAALRSFQQSNSLRATGRLDSQTTQQLGVESSAGSMGRSTTGRSSSSGMETDQSTSGRSNTGTGTDQNPSAKSSSGNRSSSGTDSGSQTGNMGEKGSSSGSKSGQSGQGSSSEKNSTSDEGSSTR
jgi:peptidoglycan hydrolase-like protein with peptidoglycan-binding domain